MGRAKRARKAAERAAKKEAKKQDTKPHEETVQQEAKHKFGWGKRILATGLLLGAAIATAIIGYNSSRTRWDFLDNFDTSRYEQVSASEVKEKYVPLGPIIGVDENTHKFREIARWAEPIVTQELRRRGASGNFSLIAYSADYGVPLEAEIAEQYKAHCEAAESFLHRELEGLDQTPLDWVIVKPGDDYSRDFDSKGFIVKGYYELFGVFLVNKNDPRDRLRGKIDSLSDREWFELLNDSTLANERLEGVMYRDGAKQQAMYAPDLSERWFFYFVMGSGEHALGAPFSELIPLSTLPATMKYGQVVGSDVASQADETIVEPLSFLLAKRYAAEMNIPGGEAIAEKNMGTLISAGGRYTFVNEALPVVMKMGEQRALDAYCRSPARFMELVKGK